MLMNKRYSLIGFGVLMTAIVIGGTIYSTVHYLTVIKPLDDMVAKYKSCAESSLNSPANQEGMTCRDNYRKAAIRRVADILDMADYTYSSSDRNPTIERGNSANRPDATIVPYLILADPSITEADQPKNPTYFVTVPSHYFYSSYSLCSKVIEPVSVDGKACHYVVRSSGTLHTTPANTAYFYIPFYPSGEYTMQHTSVTEPLSRYVLGACLEDGTIFAIASTGPSSGTAAYKGALFSQPTRASLTTTGHYPHTIQCE